MKFGKYIRTHAVPAWRHAYIDYKQLKKTIKEGEEAFAQHVLREADKTAAFFDERDADARSRLKDQRAVVLRIRSEGITSADGTSTATKRKLIDVRQSLLQLGYDVEAIQVFAALNMEGFRKIIKKFEKRTKTVFAGAATSTLRAHSFYKYQDLSFITREVETSISEIDRISASLNTSVTNHQRHLTALLDSAEIDLPSFKTALAAAGSDGDLDELLHKVCARPDATEAVSLLLDVGAQPDSHHPAMGSVLSIACAAGAEDTVRLLIAKGASFDTANHTGRRPLHFAAASGSVAVVEAFFCAESPTTPDVNIQDFDLCSPLHMAAQAGSEVIVAILIKHGAVVDARDATGATPLALAVTNGHPQAVSLLLSHDSDPMASDWQGQAPLHRACAANHTACVSMLLSKNPRVELFDQEGRSPIHEAAAAGHVDALRALLDTECAAIVNAQDSDGASALHEAAAEGHIDCVRLLCNKGADPTLVDSSGWAPGIHAVFNGHIAAGRLLDERAKNMAPDRKASQTDSPKAGDRPIAFAPNPLAEISIHVHANVEASKSLVIRGTLPSIGEGKAALCVHMSRATGFDDENVENDDEGELPRWNARVVVPRGSALHYWYAVIDTASGKDAPGKISGERKICPASERCFINDGVVGRDGDLQDGAQDREGEQPASISPLASERALGHRKPVSDGWRPDQFQLRLTINSDALSMADQIRVGRLVVSNRDGHSQMVRISDSRSELRRQSQFVFVGAAVDRLCSVTIDVFPVFGPMTGRAVLAPTSLLVGEEGSLALALLSPTTLAPVGEVVVDFLLINPLRLSTDVPRSRFFSKTSRVMGHRGVGSNLANMTAGTNATPTENSIGSFSLASELGCEYVECDVMLTRDLVPVVFHDFAIKAGPLSLPISQIAHGQFLQLREHMSADTNGIRKVIPDSKVSPEAFPTLADALEMSPGGLGFDIELKYPSDEDRRNEALDVVVNRNKFVDHILQVVMSKAGDRPIFISSFDPDICLIASVKQPTYPVFLLTEGGMQKTKLSDPRRRSIAQAMAFARSADLFGIVCNAAPLMLAPSLIKTIKDTGLVLVTYGAENNNPDTAAKQLRAGIDSIIVDHVASISSHLLRPLPPEARLVQPNVA